MSALSVKYGNPKNLEEFFFFTRDMEFTKVSVYQNGKVIHTIRDIEEFERGFGIVDSNGKEAFVQLLNRKNFTISILVDGTIFIPYKEKVESIEKTTNGSENVKPLAIYFAVALTSILINIMYLGNNPILTTLHLRHDLLIPIYRIDILSLVIIACAIAIYVLHDNRGWAYLIGLPVLFFYTVFESYYYFMLSGIWLEFPIVITVNIVVKGIIALILLGKIGTVLRNMKSTEITTSQEILD